LTGFGAAVLDDLDSWGARGALDDGGQLQFGRAGGEVLHKDCTRPPNKSDGGGGEICQARGSALRDGHRRTGAQRLTGTARTLGSELR
jgi:hypothetical protein